MTLDVADHFTWSTWAYYLVFGFSLTCAYQFEIGAFDIRNLFNWLYTVKPVRAEGQSQMS